MKGKNILIIVLSLILLLAVCSAVFIDKDSPGGIFNDVSDTVIEYYYDIALYGNGKYLDNITLTSTSPEASFRVNEDLNIYLEASDGKYAVYYTYGEIIDIVISSTVVTPETKEFRFTYTEHIHNFVVTIEPTCTEIGRESCTCAQFVQIPALGHNYVNGICSRCGVGSGTHTHSYTVTTSATCTTSGTKKCSCGDSVSIAAFGHTCISPTCADSGNVCTRCGEKYYLSHVWGEIQTYKEATCTEYGTVGCECLVCGEVDNSGAIAPLGHICPAESCSYNNICIRCDKEYTVPHTYVSGVCTVCGASSNE